MKRSSLRIGLVVLMLVAAVVPIVVHRIANPVRFNQLAIVQANLLNGRIRVSELIDATATCWTSGLAIVRGGGRAECPQLEHPEDMFEYVFSWLPPRCVVYPTEGFYYFATDVDGTRVMGNVRVADLDKGRLGAAYFTVPDKRTWSLFVDASKGLSIERDTPFSYFVEYRGKTVHFLLTPVGEAAPEQLLLLPNEQFVGHVYDESAVEFFLLFNGATTSFYYVLNTEVPLNERLDRITDTLWVGRRTGFAFYRDDEFDRMLLVGTSLEHGDRNDYFDGPQDQVPFRAEHRDLLHRAYPNTLLGDGIDEHGVFLNRKEWARIAISPFLRYARVDEVEVRIATCTGSSDRNVLWTCLTKEWWNTREWRSKMDAQLVAEGKQPLHVPAGQDR